MGNKLYLTKLTGRPNETPFQVGDLVRLRFGHTGLIVIAIEGSIVRAKYARSHVVMPEHVREPLAAQNCQTRDHAEFRAVDPCEWTGFERKNYERVQEYLNKIQHESELAMSSATPKSLMIRERDNSITNVVDIAQVTYSTDKSKVIIETMNGDISVHSASDVFEKKPTVVHAVPFRSNYPGNYYTGVTDPVVGDILLSASGHVYMIQGVNVETKQHIREFRGKHYKRAEHELEESND